MRKVLVPIHIKLVSFFVLILCCAISFYVFYATNLFKTDKTAYIFESVKNHNQSLSDAVKTDLEEKESVLTLLTTFYKAPEVVNTILKSDEDLIAFSVFNKWAQTRKYNSQVNDRRSLSGEKIKELIGQSTEKRGLYSDDLSFLIWSKEGDQVFSLEFSKLKIIDQVKNTSLFKNILVEEKSWKALSVDSNYTFLEELPKKHPSTGLSSGVIVKFLGGEKYILAFNTPFKSLKVFTLIKESIAFQATETLVNRSLYFGALIVAVVILLILLFSRIFTNPIKKLFERSREFSQNNFSNQVELSNRDELGVLADSMNEMRSSILNYMVEMQEKSRLEGEMKTAQLVQKSFFKAENLKLSGASLCGYYKPASECGGDWWGSRHILGKDIIIIFDATGHGTGAAMATAIAFNGLSAIETLSQTDESYANDPSKIMSFLNKSLCEIHGDMMATAFVAVYDSSFKRLTFSNASHNAPLKINFTSETYQKDHIEPLVQVNGRRLGEKPEEVYQSHQVDLNAGDKVLFYTDGLTEGQNNKQQDWGQRRFLKSVIKNVSLSNGHFLEGLKSDAFEYYEQTEPKDDITILTLEIDEVQSIYTYEDSFEEVLDKWEELGDFDVFKPKAGLIKESSNQRQLAQVVLAGGKSQEVKNKISSLFDNIDFSAYFGDIRGYLESLTVELVENSLVHGGSESTLQILEDDNRFTIRTEDKEGLLSKQKFFEKLRRAFKEKTFEEKESGAGLGFYLIVNLSDMIEFDLKAGSHTIIECSINKYKRLKEYKQKRIIVDFK